MEKANTSESDAARFVVFGDFELDLADETLSRDGAKLGLNRRMFQVLSLLIERRGEIVTKEEFFERVWDGNSVEDNNLTVTVTAVRKVLGDDAKQFRFIENVPRKGYRFVAPVTDAPANVDEPAAVQRSRAIGGGVLVFGALIAFGLLAFVGYRLVKSGGRPPAFDSVTVLPFQSSDPERQYLAAGLTEALRSELSTARGIRVVNVDPARIPADVYADPAAAAREVGARTVVFARVEASDVSVAIEAELIEAATGARLWHRRFTRPATDFAGVEREIADAAAPTISDDGAPPRRTRDAAAYDHYLRGRYRLGKRVEAEIKRAIEEFRAAIDIDPTFAEAYVGLADAYSLADLQKEGISRETRVELARGALRKALEIDDSIGAAHAAAAINLCFIDRDFTGAEREYRRAIELNPNDAKSHHWYAEMLSMLGRFAESRVEYEKALLLDPLSMPIRSDYALSFYYEGDFGRAAAELEKTTALAPEYARNYEFMALVRREQGRFAESVENDFKSFELRTPANSYPPAFISDRRAFFDRMRKAADARGADGYWSGFADFESVTPLLRAISAAKLGRRDEAFALIRQSLSTGDTGLVWLKVSPDFASLRNDDRFTELLQDCGFR